MAKTYILLEVEWNPTTIQDHPEDWDWCDMASANWDNNPDVSAQAINPNAYLITFKSSTQE